MTAMMVRMTTANTFFPTRQIPSKESAGMTEAIKTDSFLALVVLIRPCGTKTYYLGRA